MRRSRPAELVRARSKDFEREPAPYRDPVVSPATWLLLALVVLAAASVRVRLLNVPFERDEGEYAYTGQLILKGIPPYQSVYTQKLPGTHLAYALSMAVFGQSIAGARLGLVLATIATCVGVFLLAQRFVPARDALAGAAAYSVMALSTEMLGLFGHATHFVALFAVWGFVALASALESGDGWRYFTSGLLLGMAILMKQHGAVFLGCAAIWIALDCSTKKVRDLGVLLLGAAVPFTSIVCWLAFTGAFASFWFWVVRYGLAYGAMENLRQGWENFILAVSRFVPQAGLLWLLAACGLGLLIVRPRSVRTRSYLVAFVLLSFLGVCPGLYFRDHYFLLFLPAAALLIAVASSAATSIPTVGAWLAPALLLIACAQALYTQREVFFRAEPAQVSRLIYGPDLFPESVEIGRYLCVHTRPEDRLVVFGSEPQIPFYSRRRSATGFVFMYPLMESHRYVRQMQEAMIREVEQGRPAYAVLVKPPTSWLERPESVHRMQNWALRYLDEKYTLAGQVVVSGGRSLYLWDELATQHPIVADTQALILRRRDFVSAR